MASTASRAPACRAPICAWISPVDCWVLLASARTSSATTAKPRPLSPARAASMAALSASRLVCSAIPWITDSTTSICSLCCASRSITPAPFCTRASRVSISPPTFRAMAALSFAALRMDATRFSASCMARLSTAASAAIPDNASRLPATSLRWRSAAASALALRDARAAISVPVRCATWPASRTMGCSLSTKRLTAAAISPTSSRLSRRTLRVRSPSPAARSFSASISRRNRLTTRRPRTSASTSSTPSPTSTSPAPMRQRRLLAESSTAPRALSLMPAATWRADCSRAPSAALLSAAALARLSATSWSPLAISAEKRMSRACICRSISSVDMPRRTVPISTPFGLIGALTRITESSCAAASSTLSSARSPLPLASRAGMRGSWRFR
ncbi:hypothetical protein D3C78_1081620 [compost metagenome]